MSNLPSALTSDQFKEWILKQEVEPISFTIIASKRDAKSRRPSSYSGTVFVQYRNIEDAGKAGGYLKDALFDKHRINVEYKRKQDKREFDNANNTVFLLSTAKQLWQQMSKFKANYLQNRAAPSPALVFPNTLSP